jgi:hypothetical protein
VLIDIEDEDRSFITESKVVNGQVVMFHAPGRAIRGSIIGEVVPDAVVGAGGRGKAIYDITLLDAM